MKTYKEYAQLIEESEDLVEEYGDFDDVKVGDKIVVHKLGSFGSKRVGTHTVTKVMANHFTVDREVDGKPIKFSKRNGASVGTKDHETGKGAYGVRGFKSGHKAFKAKE